MPKSANSAIQMILAITGESDIFKRTYQEFAILQLILANINEADYYNPAYAVKQVILFEFGEVDRITRINQVNSKTGGVRKFPLFGQSPRVQNDFERGVKWL
jgi:hypothetical protein